MKLSQILNIRVIAFFTGVLIAGCATTQTANTPEPDVATTAPAPAVAPIETPTPEIPPVAPDTADAGGTPEVVNIADEEATAEEHKRDHTSDVDDANVAYQFNGAPEPVDNGTDTGTDAGNLELLTEKQPEALANDGAVDDLWERIRKGFKLNHDHKRVAGELAWYQRNQEYLNRVIDRAEPYLYMIVEEAERRGIPTEIALLPIVESAFQPFAYSHGRASGIWQFIPGTGRLYGLKQNWWYDGRRDIFASTQAAFNYLQGLADSFYGDWELALASYNTGEGNVQRAVARNKRAKKRTDFWSLKLPNETRGYVPRLLAISAIVDHPEKFGITLRPLPNKPVITQVPIDGQIDLAFAANLAELELPDLYRLNPAFNRWATDPDGPHYLVLPIDQAEVFAQRLAQFPLDQRVRWERKTVGDGETLASIAKAYGTSVDVLERVNKVKAKKVRRGRDLAIPVSMHNIGDTPLDNYAPEVRDNTPDTEDDQAPVQEKTEYVIRRGDTLYAIARRNQIGVSEIAQWNNMRIKDPLIPGHTLVLWSEPDVEEPEVASAVEAPLAGPPQEDVLRQINYVVRRGDTLGRIANRFKVSINEIRSWNRLRKGRGLRPGQRIKLHIDVTEQ